MPDPRSILRQSVGVSRSAVHRMPPTEQVPRSSPMQACRSRVSLRIFVPVQGCDSKLAAQAIAPLNYSFCSGDALAPADPRPAEMSNSSRTYPLSHRRYILQSWAYAFEIVT